MSSPSAVSPSVPPADLVRRAFEALGRRDVEVCQSMLTEDFRINIAGMPHQKRGTAAWRKNVEAIFTAFPHFTPHVEDLISDGDTVAVRLRFTGTHRGEFLGLQPTGKRVEYLSTEMYRVEGDKIAEEWICSDLMTLMTQIGGVSSTRLLSMWLAGSRTWFALGAGLMAGGAVGFALRRRPR